MIYYFTVLFFEKKMSLDLIFITVLNFYSHGNQRSAHVLALLLLNRQIILLLIHQNLPLVLTQELWRRIWKAVNKSWLLGMAFLFCIFLSCFKTYDYILHVCKEGMVFWLWSLKQNPQSFIVGWKCHTQFWPSYVIITCQILVNLNVSILHFYVLNNIEWQR